MSEEQTQNSQNNINNEQQIIINPKIDDEREQLFKNLNKGKVLNIIKTLPVETNIEYDEFKETLKLKANKLSDSEKSFLIYYWVTNNISYDTKSLISKKYIPNSPIDTFTNRKSTSTGYSRLYRDLCNKLNIESVCIKGYSKGNNFEEDIFNKDKKKDDKNKEDKKKEEKKEKNEEEKKEKNEEEKKEENEEENNEEDKEEEEEEEEKKINHEYNVVKINDKWKFIDTTLGAGYINKSMKFVKLYNEFYFCTNPSDFIYSHYPSEEKWQLLDNPINEKEFDKGVKIYEQFYKCGFLNTNLNESKYIVENPNETIVLEYDSDKYNPDLEYRLCLNGEKKIFGPKFRKRQNLFELELEFKENGIYKLEILGKNNNEGPRKTIIEYIFNHTEKPKNKANNNINTNQGSTAPYSDNFKKANNNINTNQGSTAPYYDNFKKANNNINTNQGSTAPYYDTFKKKNIKGNENKNNGQNVDKNNGPLKKKKK